MASLSEKYRPRHFAGVVGQARAVKQVQVVLARGWGGRAWWISGASGTGKTTIANLIAEAGADPFFIEELDAQVLTPAKLAEVERSFAYRAMSDRPGKAYLVNEAHGLRKDAIRLLLVMLERLPEHVCIVFTTTNAGEMLFSDDGDAAPLVSRCTQIKLDNGPSTRKAMAIRAQKIARDQKIDGFDETVYVDAVDQCRGNLRMLLSKIESGAFVEDATQRRALRAELAAMPMETKANAKRRRELAELLDAA